MYMTDVVPLRAADCSQYQASSAPIVLATTTHVDFQHTVADIEPSGLAAPTSSGGGSNAGAIAGGVVGGIVGAALIGALLFFILRRRSSETRRSGPDAKLSNPWDQVR